MLENKIVLVTGASGDIGRAIAVKAHAQGAHVILHGTNRDKLDRVADSLRERCEVRVCDLADTQAIKDMAQSIDQIHALVCNAGITDDALAMRMKDESFDRVIDVNLKANFILNREMLTKMLKARGEYGRIINISSVVAFTGNPGQANYCASKAGLIGMTKALALEVASRGVTVNAIAPGFIVSQMTEKLAESQKDMIAQRIPMKRLGLPEDVAACAMFLLSQEAAYVTGQTLHVNGGLFMH
ncbi:3-oxoacyl-[acyl-carrier-protein] reductase FabG [Rickettsiales endosymbiont of Paramecium tredecaurelia]|uniref:3-oxoacyl-ACP reductase FabG n=1 Tax=Candidatus Sarmatiella mevalonica TaxID=2770581 RepID=UPI001924E62B|nr:3-oxoacyl-ACP reductase FabG [Candidatus Sarmatiella mevalonica]MBL3284473.1 3-oxoacyl-[acyl-carrier-protein] reductase FabG [Candidatus Sarmatiella mevalonica]